MIDLNRHNHYISKSRTSNQKGSTLKKNARGFVLIILIKYLSLRKKKRKINKGNMLTFCRFLNRIREFKIRNLYTSDNFITKLSLFQLTYFSLS